MGRLFATTALLAVLSACEVSWDDAYDVSVASPDDGPEPWDTAERLVRLPAEGTQRVALDAGGCADFWLDLDEVAWEGQVAASASPGAAVLAAAGALRPLPIESLAVGGQDPAVDAAAQAAVALALTPDLPDAMVGLAVIVDQLDPDCALGR